MIQVASCNHLIRENRLAVGTWKHSIMGDMNPPFPFGKCGVVMVNDLCATLAVVHKFISSSSLSPFFFPFSSHRQNSRRQYR